MQILNLLHQLWILWAFLLFSGIVIWAFWPSRGKEMEHCARIPLDDEEAGHAHQD